MKSFIDRKINAKISLSADTFASGGDTADLSDLRCQATIQSLAGTAGTFASQLQMRISGMKNADMAKLSTLGLTAGAYNINTITVTAGDDVNGMTQVFSGGIQSGDVDYNSMPDVGVEIVASAGANFQYTKVAASSYQGDQQVTTMLSALAGTAGLSFHNNGVTAALSNHATGGTATDQIEDICNASNTLYAIENKTLFIWPSTGYRDDTAINVSPDTGMVGYPRYVFNGLQLTTLFNPTAAIGRKVNVTTSTPTPSKSSIFQGSPINAAVPTGANGTFYCWQVTHELASQTPNGPWFTHLLVSALNPNG